MEFSSNSSVSSFKNFYTFISIAIFKISFLNFFFNTKKQVRINFSNVLFLKIKTIILFFFWYIENEIAFDELTFDSLISHIHVGPVTSWVDGLCAGPDDSPFSAQGLKHSLLRWNRLLTRIFLTANLNTFLFRIRRFVGLSDFRLD